MSKTKIHQLVLIQMSDEFPEADRDGDLILQEQEAELSPPSMYHVILLNDDYTPMEFVVEVLERIFGMSREQSTQIMLTVHTKGRAQCGLYTKDIAETKMAQVLQFARENDHPLLCEIEEAQL